MAEACTSTHEQQQITTSTANTATGGAPPPHRRPRVRERCHAGPDPLSSADENKFDIHLSSKTPQCLQRKVVLPVQQRIQRAVKLFKENECSKEQQLQDPETIHSFQRQWFQCR
ncbi:TPA_asm: hypothetical protein HUJ06_019175 [Nelumbo nucifera]|uniref:Uncharacterized protein n=1 Tax=Nelumbo nucifera TaxID=4432 RepID=A0A823A103_NELNU|nr:TPA_asm: hypothetical protein HUJ06_019175 [Nelumbo nucifera]